MRQELLNPKLCIYTDGSGNTKWEHGYWAWCAYLPVIDKDPIAVGFGPSDNNKSGRAELTAVANALEWLININDSFSGFTAHFYPDAEYIVKAIRWGWLDKWRANGWVKTSYNMPVENQDLWKTVYERMEHIRNSTQLTLDFDHVYGHEDCMGNNLADRLCTYSRVQDQKGTFLPEQFSGMYGYKQHSSRPL